MSERGGNRTCLNKPHYDIYMRAFTNQVKHEIGKEQTLVDSQNPIQLFIKQVNDRKLVQTLHDYILVHSGCYYATTVNIAWQSCVFFRNSLSEIVETINKSKGKWFFN